MSRSSGGRAASVAVEFTGRFCLLGCRLASDLGGFVAMVITDSLDLRGRAITVLLRLGGSGAFKVHNLSQFKAGERKLTLLSERGQPCQ